MHRLRPLRAVFVLALASCALLAQAQNVHQNAEPDKHVQTRLGTPVSPNAMGGPDTFGYTFIDSNEAAGPAFDWMDISATGTALALGDDDHAFPIALPFTFSFYGVDHTELAVGSNGIVYFEDAYLGLTNTPIPGPTDYVPQTFIAGYWDDLYPPGGTGVFHQTLGTAPYRVQVVQWQNVPRCCSAGISPVTFQILLYEGSNDIRVQYLDPSALAGSLAGVGIQGSTTAGLQYSHDTAALTAQLAVCFVAPGSTHPCSMTRTVSATANPVAGGTATGTGDFELGATAMLTAVPATGYAFQDWSGDLTSTANPLSFTVTDDTALVANFVLLEYTLGVTTSGSGSVSRSPDQPTYQHDDVVVLTATADPGWTFAGWSGDASGSLNPLNVTMTGDTDITATFTQDSYTLTLATSGSGTLVASPQQATYLFGDMVTLTATPAAGSSFAGWSGDASGSTNPLTITITGDASVTAGFTQDSYTLALGTAGNGSLSASPQQATYAYGDAVTLTATPAAGWNFAGWSGDASGTVNPLSINITGNIAVTATFTQPTFAVVLTTTGNGSVSLSPAQANYVQGDTVTLTATPAPGWEFVGWSGSASGSDNPLVVTIDGDLQIEAAFGQAIAPLVEPAVIPATTPATMLLLALLALGIGWRWLRRD